MINFATRKNTLNSTMASNDKNPQEEATGIENLNSHLTSAGEKIANNKKIIYWAVGIIAIIGAGLSAYFFLYRNPALNKSYEAYNQVELDAMGNDSIAAAKYMDVAKKYGNSYGGNLAYFDAGMAYYRQGKYKEALAALNEFSSEDEVLDANAAILRGDCNVNLNKYPEAIKCFEEAISRAKDNIEIAPRALLKEANVYSAQKKYADALKCYETIKTQYPEFKIGNGLTIDAYIEREKARLGK